MSSGAQEGNQPHSSSSRAYAGHRLSLTGTRGEPSFPNSGGLGPSAASRKISIDLVTYVKQLEQRGTLEMKHQEATLERAGNHDFTRLSMAQRRSLVGIRDPADATADDPRKLEIKKETEQAVDLLAFDYHVMTVKQVQARLGVDPERGLTQAQRELLLKQNGPNKVPEPKKPNGCVLFLRTQRDFFAILLWVAAIVSIISFLVQKYVQHHEEMHNVYLGIALILINIMSGLITYFQEAKTTSIMNSFANLTPDRAWILTDGKELEVDSETLVKGDVVLLRNGSKIPADVRIFQANALKVDMSSFTGESEPQARKTEPSPENVHPLEAANIGFFTTLILNGEGRGIVVETGANTMMGKLAHSINSQKQELTPIQVEINRFVKLISIIAICIGVLFFILSLSLGIDWLESFLFGVGIIVANVPEGLSLTIAVSLTLAAKRMKNKNILVKQLSSVETLGSCSVICSDKTGTITANQMNVSHLWAPRKDFFETEPQLCDCNPNFAKGSFSISRPEYHFPNQDLSAVPPQCRPGSSFSYTTTLSWRMYYIVAKLCSRASFIDTPENQSSNLFHKAVNGDASEAGILRFTTATAEYSSLGASSTLDDIAPKIAELPFNSTNKFQSSIHALSEDFLRRAFISNNHKSLFTGEVTRYYKDEYGLAKGVHLAVMKGAPERIIERCTYYLNDDFEGGISCIDPSTDEGAAARSRFITSYSAAYERIAGFGERVLALAFRVIPDEERSTTPIDGPEGKVFYDAESTNFPGIHNMVFVGLISLHDPPKDGVLASVQQCSKAHISVAMVTGDHYLTAQAIAAQVSIIKDIDDVDMYTTPQSSNIQKNDPFITRFSSAAEQFQKLADNRATAGVNDGGKEEGNDTTKNAKKTLYKKKGGYKEDLNKFSRNNRAQFSPFPPSDLLKTSAVMTGDVLINLSPLHLQEFVAIYSSIVFARTTPDQKLAIVDAYKNNGKVVAVSGDGSNDAPALKCADIGVAMASGSDVARDAGNIILLDNSFNSIVTGVMEGRLIFENLRKSLAYTITSAVPQLLPFLLFVLFGFPNAMSSIMILLVDVFSDIWPAFAMAYEGEETDIMIRPPRDLKKDTLIDGRLLGFAYGQMGVIQALALICTFMLTILSELRARFIFKDGVKVDLLNTTKLFVDIKHSVFSDRLAGYIKDFLTQNGSTNIADAYRGSIPIKDANDTDAILKVANDIFYYGQTASFISVIESQFFDAIVSRTRLNSIFKQKMNWMMLGGLCLQIGLAAAFAYIPIFHVAFLTRPIAGISWVWTLPFCAFMFFYDEMRKLILRLCNPNRVFNPSKPNERRPTGKNAKGINKLRDRIWRYWSW